MALGVSDGFRSPTVVLGVLRLADVVVVGLSAGLAYWLRHGHLDAPFTYVVMTVIGVVLVANVLHAAKVYVFETALEFTAQVHKLSISLPMVFLILMALGYFTKTAEDLSRIWMALWFVLSFGGLVVVRTLLLIHLHHWQRRGWLTRNLVIIGAGETGRRLVRHLIDNAEPGTRLLGLFDDRRTRVPAEIEGYEVLGTVSDIVAYVRDHRVDEIIIALPWTNKPRVIDCMNKLRSVTSSVHLCPDTIGFHLYNRGVSHLAGLPLFQVWKPPLSGWSVVVKAVEDRVLSALILLLIIPTMAVIALLVKLDSPGPVLFRQKRYGFNNNLITVYKFRSMVADPASADGAQQATRDDARVTRLGGFLRRYSLDELPQFFNVLKGEMSIVGPRPHAVPHNEQYTEVINDYLARHKVKPGITGWAQVNGLRGETDLIEKMEARVEHDLYYVDNWSLLFDLRIILLTLLVGFQSKDVY
ncbi:MAG: undecaprenyl-phosphate glucose phosphotransferase [Proteobacteria bacterium]|nr:undecaprenyl-phosphate glucose phosphotransferase [Pseudomonadota bacterium]